MYERSFKQSKGGMTVEDKEIIELYFARKEDVTRIVSEKYGVTCLKIAKNIVGNDEDAKECVNDAYFALWNRIPPEKPERFSSYLWKIVRNISLDRFDYNTAACRNGNTETVLEEIADFLPDTQAQAESPVLMPAINTFLGTQPKAARSIFVRRYFYCDSIEDIALRYGMSKSAVTSSLFRIRKRLASYLKKQGFGGDYFEK